MTSLTSHFVPLRLALRGYSVASLPRRFAPSALRASRSHSRSLRALRSNSRSLRSLEIFKKKSVSQSTQNGLKRIKMQKNFFTLLTRFARSERSERRSATLPTPAVASLPRASRSRFSVASLPRASRFALRARYLPHATPRVPRSVHAKFHADWSTTVGARGTHTHSHTNTQTDRPSFII